MHAIVPTDAAPPSTTDQPPGARRQQPTFAKRSNRKIHMISAHLSQSIRTGVLTGLLAFSLGAASPTAAQQEATLAPQPLLSQANGPDAAAPANSALLVTGTNAAPKAAENNEPEQNPYGLVAIWNYSDSVARFVLLVLIIMSVGTWYILVAKLLEQNKINRSARKVDEQFWGARTVAEAAKTLDQNSAYRYIAEAGASAIGGHAGLKRHIPLEDWVPMSIDSAVQQVNATTQKGLAFLATVGSTSPFIGLFGTVWGIYHALTAIGMSGQASIDKVAGPVGEALIMTAIGLAVAIPAVLAYNWLARRNKALMDDVHEFGNELCAVVVGSTQGR